MTRFAAGLLACLVTLVLVAVPAAAEPSVIDMRFSQQGDITVGDRIRYTIVLDVEAGTDVSLVPASLPSDVALADTPLQTRDPAEPGREQVSISFDVAPFRPGEVEVPPLEVVYTLPGGATGIIQSPGSLINVSSVLPAGGQVAPRDLKPQAEIGTPPSTWPRPVAAAAISALALLIAFALIRRQIAQYRASRALRNPPVLSGPEDIARGILNQTRAAFDTTGDVVRYYTSLSNTVRYYLTQRYGFPAFALTTRELEEAMVERGLDRWQIRVATGLLNQCDAVVYARYRPAPERADADLTAAYEIVEMSRPEERPMTEAQEGATVA